MSVPELRKLRGTPTSWPTHSPPPRTLLRRLGVMNSFEGSQAPNSLREVVASVLISSLATQTATCVARPLALASNGSCVNTARVASPVGLPTRSLSAASTMPPVTLRCHPFRWVACAFNTRYSLLYQSRRHPHRLCEVRRWPAARLGRSFHPSPRV